MMIAAIPAAAGESCGSKELYGVIINGEPVSDGTIFLRHGPELLAPADEVAQWRLRMSRQALQICDGRKYVPLSSLQKVSFTEDPLEQAVRLQAAPTAFETTIIGGSPPPPPPPAPSTGLYVNYDLYAMGGTLTGTRFGGLMETVLFTPAGSGSSTFLARDYGFDRQYLRLESAWITDDVAHMTTYRVGDAVTRPGLLGGWTRFCGIQAERRFSLQPYFIMNPLPALLGSLAQQPSTVEVFVNNAQTMMAHVPAGPYDLPAIPVTNGAGEVTVYVQDLLGREQAVTRRIYATPVLLREGVSEFSYGAGVERQDYALESNEYGRLIAYGTHRYGVNDYLTAELHAEAFPGGGMAAAGGYITPRIPGLFTMMASGSSFHGYGGYQMLASYDYHGGWFGVGGSFLFGNSRYHDLSDIAPLHHEGMVYGSLGMGRFGSINVSYADRRRYWFDSANLLTASYTLGIGPATVSVAWFEDLADRYGRLITASLTVVLDSRRTVTAYSGTSRYDQYEGVELQQSFEGGGSGTAFRLRGEKGDYLRYLEGEVIRRTEVADVDFRWTQADEWHAWRGGISGSVALMRGVVQPGRRISESFAIAEVPGVKGVTVYADNQEIGKTDGSGFILVPNLRPYDRNVISISADDIPLTATIGGTSEVAVPASLGGTRITFPVRKQFSVVARLVDDDGKPLPPGTVMRGKKGREWTVALDGIVYLEDVMPGTLELAAERPAGRCRASLVVPETQEKIGDLGAHRCSVVLTGAI